MEQFAIQNLKQYNAFMAGVCKLKIKLTLYLFVLSAMYLGVRRAAAGVRAYRRVDEGQRKVM
jgi:hypothetical protein